IRNFLEIDKTRMHPFRPDLIGSPALFLIVSDDELYNPRTDAGLARHRAEFAAYRYDAPKSGEPARNVMPYPLFNDAMDSLRGLAAAWFPMVLEKTPQERARERAEQSFPVGDPHPPADMSRQYYYNAYLKEESKPLRWGLGRLEDEADEYDRDPQMPDWWEGMG